MLCGHEVGISTPGRGGNNSATSRRGRRFLVSRSSHGIFECVSNDGEGFGGFPMNL